MSRLHWAKGFSLLSLAIVLFSSCASLTKSQLNEVNAFGKLSSDFSSYPVTVITTYNRIHQEQELYRANTLDDPKAHFEAIEKANDFKQKTDLITLKIDLSLKIIDQYAQGLILLTSNEHTAILDTAARSFGSTLDTLISLYNRKAEPGANMPTGIGSAVAAVITLGGQAYIQKKQADDIKQVVPLGDKIIEKMTGNVLEFLDGKNAKGITLKDLIAAEKNSISRNYQDFVRHQKLISMDDERYCLQMLADLDNAEKLRVQCIEATQNLRKAHAELLKDIGEKKTLKQYASQLIAYEDDIHSLYSTLKAIKK